MQRIFILVVYSGLIRGVAISNFSAQFESVFGRKVDIKEYRVLKGERDYAERYRFLWLKGGNYIKAILDSEADSIAFTIKDLETEKYYLFLADKELLNDPNWLNGECEEIEDKGEVQEYWKQ